MEPRPLFESPPEIDQVTAAAPPPASVAVNCSTDAPCELVVLQPLQLVSMDAVPGEMEKVEFEEPVLVPPHPAARSTAGANRSAHVRKYRFRIVKTLRTLYRRHPRKKGSEQLATHNNTRIAGLLATRPAACLFMVGMPTVRSPGWCSLTAHGFAREANAFGVHGKLLLVCTSMPGTKQVLRLIPVMVYSTCACV
jgi:hypothetical protein